MTQGGIASNDLVRHKLASEKKMCTRNTKFISPVNDCFDYLTRRVKRVENADSEFRIQHLVLRPPLRQSTALRDY